MDQILIIFIIIALGSAVHGQVYIQPQNYTIFPNGHVISTCKGFSTGSLSQIHFTSPENKQISASQSHLLNYFNSYGIYLNFIAVHSNSTWTINITGIQNTNKVEFKCKFYNGDFYTSKKSVITVINVTLLAPMITEYNETYIELVWSSLEYINVTNYTLSITNVTTGSTTNIITNSTVWTLTQEQPSTSSHPLIISVEAFTDYGSVRSSSITTGFPKKLTAVNKNNITVDIFKKLNNGGIRVEISFVLPTVFSYQTLHYNITVEDFNDTTIKHNWNEHSSPLTIDDLLIEGRAYKLSFSIWETFREENVLVTTKLFSITSTSLASTTAAGITSTSLASTAITSIATTSTTPAGIITSTSTVSTSSIPTIATSSTSTKASTGISSELIIGIASGVGSLFLILILIIVLVLMFILLRLRRIQRPTIAQNVMEEKDFRQRSMSLPVTKNRTFRERSQTMPRTMATNPIYEATTPVYDIMPDNLKGSTATTIPLPSANNNNNNDLYIEIPPQVPPPRKATLDSPGIKSGTEVALSKVAQLGEEPNRDDNSDYMYMRSSQSRYVKSPVPLRSKETIKPSTLSLNNNEERGRGVSTEKI